MSAPYKPRIERRFVGGYRPRIDADEKAHGRARYAAVVIAERNYPGLLHARKVQRRAATAGFDWPDLDGPLAKMREELAEIEVELARTGRPAPRPAFYKGKP